MKILFVLEYYYPNVGGIEKLFKNLAEALANEGHEITVITNKFAEDLQESEKINGVSVRRLRFKNRFLFTFLSLNSILKLAKDFDVIHTTSYNAALPASIAGKILHKKVLITFHEVWGKLWFKLPFLNYVQKLMFYSFEKLILKLPYHQFIAVSEATKLDLINHNIPSEKITRIYNGIDYDSTISTKKLPAKNFTFTFLGRLGVSKGLDLLIPAAKKFISEYPDSVFQLITPDSPTSIFKKINKLTHKYPMAENFKWYQNLNHQQIQNKLISSHCIVIPSYSEGFCFVAAEASALKIPIISSNKKALKEVVSGKHINVDSLDIDGIYQALIKAKDGKFTKGAPMKFTFKESLKAYLKLYKSIQKNI